ncbi:hypothetical protein TNCV_3962691 [Trichonephila clavipes]|nr:hypothetical protein TNCV_3962691 [Trichonephila clavipes]
MFLQLFPGHMIIRSLPVRERLGYDEKVSQTIIEWCRSNSPVRTCMLGNPAGGPPLILLVNTHWDNSMYQNHMWASVLFFFALVILRMYLSNSRAWLLDHLTL